LHGSGVEAEDGRVIRIVPVVSFSLST